MKILLDNIIYSKVKNGGVSNYWFELSKYVLNQPQDQVKFFEEKDDLSNFHRQLLAIPQDHIIPYHSKVPFLSRRLPIYYESNEKLIYHSSYYRGLSGAKNKIEVTTVYDFIHDYYSSFLKKAIHNNLKYSAIKRSKGVICISKNTYSDLQKFCPTRKNQKAEVIYVGVSDDYFPTSNLDGPQKQFLTNHHLENGFLLFVGGRTNYKNFDFVASVINENKDLKLVVVGGGMLNENEVKLFTKEAFSRVVFIGSVKNEELNILFNHALALLYPSSYEGFGIPVVEAMRAGCPVIGLNNATIREVAEDSALLLDYLDIKDFSHQKQKLMNATFRSETIAKGLLESQKYSWEKSSRETYEFYTDLYDSSL
ncbi:glycosyltransferase family 1 protein [Flavobacterium sp.]|uniref:glycosyltransferase family 4 protein n=1 Tax=Flavobacterium sp. TaxID=239 RepID=UPI00286BF846|nr:glycosyltransferase family 1 protein [Flavobacterium sp.]